MSVDLFILTAVYLVSRQDKPPQPIYGDPRYQPTTGANLLKKEWVTFNRVRTGVGRFNFNMSHWCLN